MLTLMVHGFCFKLQDISSVQFSHSVMPDTLRLHESQHARPHSLSPTSRVYSNSWTLNWGYYPTISSSVVPFSSFPQSFLASGSFQMSQLFTSGGQSTGVSASTSVLPNEHPGVISFRIDWLDPLAIQGTLESGDISKLRHLTQWKIKYTFF